MVSYITELNESNFDSFVSKEGVVLVDIWATWCGPCKVIAPIIDELSVEYLNKIRVGKCDADANRDKVMSLGVRNIPTIFIYKDGQLMESSAGAATKAKLVELIERHLENVES
jgi:thioredoxin 1